ncbi:MAG: (2Fe-2S)-binding protein [Treponema sp.]|jgi:NAD-dependent dihydropyrimidine dehydrogenase PreA subunit|nr:(2Fe-2S)-binding protein [Treponema sp.]
MSHEPNPNKSVNLTIDGILVTVPEGTTILEAAKKARVNIPTLCHHPDLCKRAVCRICVVECDGRGKLAAACAQDAWEGLSVVTKSVRVINIRKTIIELLLANHPQGCLTCVRNTRCELQSLAEVYGVRSLSFTNDVEEKPVVIESETLVRDMGKCIKCGRCVEACQEVQTVRAINSSRRGWQYEICAPYKEALSEGPCAFCCQCAAVCPVGAIYEHDQSSEVMDILINKKREAVAQVSPSLAEPLNDELGLPKGTITTGKIISALKLLGFEKVYNAAAFEKLSLSERQAELEQRIKSGGLLPMITGNSAGLANFVNYFYPDLSGNLSRAKNARQVFAAFVKAEHSQETASVSFFPGLAQKYNVPKRVPDKEDFALSVRELSRLIKMADIDIVNFQETPFDTANANAPEPDGAVKIKIVYDYAEARKVLDSARKGECDAQWIEIGLA